MIVVDSTSENHTSKIYPRFEPSQSVIYEIYNETTREATEIPNTYTFSDGIMSISYTYTFNEGAKFQVKVTQGERVIFRGKLIAISQDTQDYNPIDGIYTYSQI